MRVVDKSGVLRATEFARVCYDMGLFLDQTDVEAAMHIVDTEKNGYDFRGLDAFQGDPD